MEIMRKRKFKQKFEFKENSRTKLQTSKKENLVKFEYSWGMLNEHIEFIRQKDFNNLRIFLDYHLLNDMSLHRNVFKKCSLMVFKALILYYYFFFDDASSLYVIYFFFLFYLKTDSNSSCPLMCVCVCLCFLVITKFKNTFNLISCLRGLMHFLTKLSCFS